MPRLLRAAMAAANRGWPVFPLIPGSKRPAISGWQFAASVDADVLETWWARAPYNIGIACESAGLLVVDLDGVGTDSSGRTAFTELIARADAVAEPTYTVATPSGGEHRYFSVQSGQLSRSTAGLLGKHIDTRGAGGYVVAADSVGRICGHCRYYRVTDPRAPEPLPRWLAKSLARPAAPQHSLLPRTLGLRSGYVRAAVAAETALVRAARPGTRNTALFRAAVSLGTLAASGDLDETEVRDLLIAVSTVHIGVNDFTTSEADRAIANGLRYGLRRPRYPHWLVDRNPVERREAVVLR